MTWFSQILTKPEHRNYVRGDKFACGGPKAG
jgi:hypothetical protein